MPPNRAGASGYYQIIPSTWRGFGGTGPAAYLASKAEQDRTVEALVKGARELKAGDGLDESATLCPVINPEQRQRILAAIERGVREGAKLVLDGRGLTVPSRPHCSSRARNVWRSTCVVGMIDLRRHRALKITTGRTRSHGKRRRPCRGRRVDSGADALRPPGR